ncbi:hypothetical protein NPIL_269571 [Nephila pilipes]|uniref:Uncharacterized protein n=1 Tax=Nephila pilipes TaxID=299642 RepID=A0A8X6P258_NEPPI|nr:hypothetical protein NPIL_269571 [Nephila pilipes]
MLDIHTYSNLQFLSTVLFTNEASFTQEVNTHNACMPGMDVLNGITVFIFLPLCCENLNRVLVSARGQESSVTIGIVIAARTPELNNSPYFSSTTPYFLPDLLQNVLAVVQRGL